MITETTLILFTHNDNKIGVHQALISILDGKRIPTEIIIMDNSLKNNSDYYLEYIDRKDVSVRYIHNLDNVNFLYNTSRQKGISEAKYKLIILAEDDATYDGNFIASIVEEYESGHNLIGYKIIPNQTFNNANWKYINEGRFDTDFGLIDYGEKNKIISPNLIFNSFAFNKEIYEKSNGWAPDGFYTKEFFLYNYGGETDLAQNMGEILSEAWYSASSVMIHQNREDRMNNKYFILRYSYFGISRGWESLEKELKNINIKEKKSNILVYIGTILKLCVGLIAFNIIKFLLNKNSWKNKIFLKVVMNYNINLVKYYFLTNSNLREYLKNYRITDWKIFDFSSLVPVKYGIWKPLCELIKVENKGNLGN